MSKELEYFQEIIKVDEEALTLANKEKNKKRDVMLHRHWLNIRKNSIELALKEHEQYKVIEKELGISLVALFNILRTGGHIWVKNCKGINEWHVESLKQRGLDKQWYLTYSNNVRVKLKDYGKTWALTREELEK